MTGAADAELVGLYRALITAWNAREANSYAALCSPQALIVGFDGSQMSGTEVREQLVAIFADHETAPYVCKVRAVRTLTPQVGLLTAIAGMRPPGSEDLSPQLNAVHSLVVARSDTGKWLVELFQNTPAAYHGRPELTAWHLTELRGLANGVG